MADPLAGGPKTHAGCISLVICAVIGSLSAGLAVWALITGGLVTSGEFLIAAAVAFGAIAVAEARR